MATKDRRTRTQLAIAIIAILGLTPCAPLFGQFPHDLVLSLTDDAASPGGSVELRSLLDNIEWAHGWAWGACHDPAVLAVESAGDGATTATINQGGPPDWAVYDLYPEGWTVGVVICFEGCAMLPAGLGYELAISSYTVISGNPGDTTEVCYCDVLGTPPATTVIVYDGQSLVPIQECGTAEILLPQQYIRGDCNDDGTVNVADGVFLLNALFQGGDPSSCTSACDANADGPLDLADAIFGFQYIFSGGPPPPAPFPACGMTPADDCEVQGSCP